MKKNTNAVGSQYVELVACQEAANILKAAILEKLRNLVQQFSIGNTVPPTDNKTCSTLIDEMRKSQDDYEICALGKHLFDYIKLISSKTSKAGSFTFLGLKPPSKRLDPLRSDLDTLAIVTETRRDINQVIFNLGNKGSAFKRAAAVEDAFNLVVKIPSIQTVLKQNTTIQPTGFFQLCKQLWRRLCGVKTAEGRFFRTETTAQKNVQQLSAAKTETVLFRGRHSPSKFTAASLRR